MQFSEFPLRQRLNWWNVFFFLTTPLAAIILVPSYLLTYGVNLNLLVFVLLFYAACSFSITAGYHRLFTHRSYEVRLWVKLFFLVFGAAAFQGSALQWCTDHRRHHRYADTDEDPYNINRGFFYAHMGWLLYKEDPKYRGVFLPDLAKDKWIELQHRVYVPFAIAMGFIFPMLVGWWLGDAMGGLLLGGLCRIVVSQHFTFLINSAAHSWGKRPYNDASTARDSFVLAVLTHGEGYHNFHHQFQSDFRNGVRWYQWDPTKWVIQAMYFLGWSYRLKRMPAWEILKANLKVQQTVFSKHGVPVERFQTLKGRVEQAQQHWRNLREEYQRLKTNVQWKSRKQVLQLKAEIKMAKLEFKMSCAQLLAYTKALKLAMAYD